jgi:hypothetical protein
VRHASLKRQQGTPVWRVSEARRFEVSEARRFEEAARHVNWVWRSSEARQFVSSHCATVVRLPAFNNPDKVTLIRCDVSVGTVNCFHNLSHTIWHMKGNKCLHVCVSSVGFAASRACLLSGLAYETSGRQSACRHSHVVWFMYSEMRIYYCIVLAKPLSRQGNQNVMILVRTLQPQFVLGICKCCRIVWRQVSLYLAYSFLFLSYFVQCS